MVNILVVEDDKGLREGMEIALKRDDFHFTLCGTLAEADARLCAAEKYDLILLDLNLPDGTGYELLKKLQGSGVPVIILTANDWEMDEVQGLELGAEDYITKPFSLMVLRARIEKALKKKRGSTVYKTEELEFCFEEQRFWVNRQEIFLSRTEAKLLRLLTENENRVLRRELLLDRIWPGDSEFVDENALSVTVGRLRSKLGKEAGGFLKTVYGEGYVWRRS